MKKIKLLAASVLVASAFAAHAEITISPMVGYHVFDSEMGVSDHTEGSFALGYRVNANVGTELRYAQSNPSIDGVDADLRYEAATLDVYYRFNPTQKLQPYGLIGAGLVRGTAGGVEEHTAANAAVGAFYQLTRRFSLRGELRGVHDLQESRTDGVASLGVLYAFLPAKAMVAPVAVAPVALPPADDDQDTVLNPVDRCPNTPTNVVVDADGCPRMKTETITRELRVLFDTNKAVVKPKYLSEVEAVAKLLQEFPTATAEVQGHTDSVGSAKYNEKLSNARAKAVAELLVKKFGIAAERVTSKGYGLTQPASDNATAEGRSKNRRTVGVAQGEFKVVLTK